jgi:hypothetical protein
VFLLCYLENTIWAAAHASLWMDEVLSVWTIRLGSPRAIYSALARGSEPSPPLFHLIQLYFTKIAGSSYLAYRLPSIFAVLLTGACTLVLVRRYLGLAPALLASCLVIDGLRPYALQVRAYALTTTCFAAALLLWDRLDRPGSLLWRQVLIALLLAMAIALHFYSVLYVVCFGWLELLYEIVHRKFRLGVWIALFVGGASVFLWLPLIHVINRYNVLDISSPFYFALPTLRGLVRSYSDSMFESPIDIDIFFAVLALFAAASLTRFLGPVNEKERRDRFSPLAFLAIALLPFLLHRFVLKRVDARPILLALIFIGAIVRLRSRQGEGFAGKKFKTPSSFIIMFFAVACLPLITFLFSLFVSHGYNTRYILPVIIGTCAATAVLFAFSTTFVRVAPAALLIVALATLAHRKPTRGDVDTSNLFRYNTGHDPIVIADAPAFFSFEEKSSPAFHDRLVFLTGQPEPDPTAEHELERWKIINPSLPIYPVTDFLASHPHFYVLDKSSQTHLITGYLLARHLITPVSRSGDSELYTSTN